MNKKPKILITNDDGVLAPGIRHLADSLTHFADITVAAPLTEQSAASLGLTLYQPLHLEELNWSDGRQVWGISGKPADCVKIALHELFDDKPDFILSGINRGGNYGRTFLYSGTVAATIEGTLQGVPGIAFSCCNYEEPDYLSAALYIPKILQYFMAHPIPSSTIVNVNFPMCKAEEVKGVRLAKQGQEFLAENPDKRVHPSQKRPYFWLGLKTMQFPEHEESDVHLLNEGYVTAVPIKLSEFTHDSMYAEQGEQFSQFFNV